MTVAEAMEITEKQLSCIGGKFKDCESTHFPCPGCPYKVTYEQEVEALGTLLAYLKGGKSEEVQEIYRTGADEKSWDEAGL